MRNKKQTILAALGGNALIKKGQEGNATEQLSNLRFPIRQIARLYDRYRIIITHGNGPQVGNLLLQQETCDTVPKMPLEVLVAQTQGQIGYMIEATLDSEFMALERNHQIPMVSLITYVAVEADDPAFKKPTKPIGPVFSESRAGSVSFTTVKTPKGYRRVVASPKPVTIIEKKEIKKLIGMDFIVICCGGGGIPVIRNGRKFSGIDAVIDKDLASAKLAEEVGVDILLIATDVPGVALNYGEPNERFLPTLTIARAEQHMKSGHFPEGSIGPKVEAAVQFIQNGGKRAVITSLDAIEAAVAGKVGTQFLA